MDEGIGFRKAADLRGGFRATERGKTPQISSLGPRFVEGLFRVPRSWSSRGALGQEGRQIRFIVAQQKTRRSANPTIGVPTHVSLLHGASGRIGEGFPWVHFSKIVLADMNTLLVERKKDEDMFAMCPLDFPPPCGSFVGFGEFDLGGRAISPGVEQLLQRGDA